MVTRKGNGTTTDSAIANEKIIVYDSRKHSVTEVKNKPQG